jgi:hypothetical protein
MLTLISNKNLGFTKPKCNCGINTNKFIKSKNRKYKTRKYKTKSKTRKYITKNNS